ncbi:MAG: DMT family transporter [Alphaproteobacteria bacterium]|nr:DMT family transporter [Alphaproteobacteria bacterium]
MATLAAARPSDPLMGALWMSLAAFSLAAMAVIVRYLTPTYHVFELIFLRNLISLAFFTPWILQIGFRAVRTQRLGEHVVRNSIHYVGMVAWFFGVTMVPLAELAALQFTMPLFAIILAAIILGEKIGRGRWIATLIGFSGALVIIRPDLAGVSTGSLVVASAAFFYATSYVITKRLSTTESPNTVVFWMNLIVVVIALGPALLYWKTPALADLPLLVLLGVTGYTTHYCLTRSFKMGDVSFVTLFDFLRLPFSAVFGFVLFAEMPVIWTFVGAVIIFGAAYYITWTETRRAKARTH